MSDGRTIWQAQDTGWYRRERIVDLGHTFGPGGPCAMNWLELEAKVQNDAGRVKAGYMALAHGAFLQGGHEEARRIVAHAVQIGFLTDFEEGERTFTAVIRSFGPDQRRGRAALRQSDRREQDVTERDMSPLVTDCHVPVGTEEKRREEKNNPPKPPQGGGDGKVVRLDRRPVPAQRVALAEQVLEDYNDLSGQRLSPYTGRGRPSDGLQRILGALTDWPDRLSDREKCRKVIQAGLGSRWWGDGPASVGVVFGPRVVGSNLELAEKGGVSVVDDEVARLVARTEAKLAAGGAA